MSREFDRFGEPIASAENEVARDKVSLSAGMIFFAVLGIIGSLGLWYVMLPVLAIVLCVGLCLGWSPQRAVLKTLTVAGMVLSGIAVVGLAIFTFLIAICLMNPPSFH